MIRVLITLVVLFFASTVHASSWYWSRVEGDWYVWTNGRSYYCAHCYGKRTHHLSKASRYHRPPKYDLTNPKTSVDRFGDGLLSIAKGQAEQNRKMELVKVFNEAGLLNPYNDQGPYKSSGSLNSLYAPQGSTSYGYTQEYGYQAPDPIELALMNRESSNYMERAMDVQSQYVKGREKLHALAMQHTAAERMQVDNNSLVRDLFAMALQNGGKVPPNRLTITPEPEQQPLTTTVGLSGIMKTRCTGCHYHEHKFLASEWQKWTPQQRADVLSRISNNSMPKHETDKDAKGEPLSVSEKATFYRELIK